MIDKITLNGLCSTTLLKINMCITHGILTFLVATLNKSKKIKIKNRWSNFNNVFYYILDIIKFHTLLMLFYANEIALIYH